MLVVIAFVLGDPLRIALAGQAEHVVVVVWDGMRPDFVSPQFTPTLHQLATNGTTFKNHHSSYVTSTEVNGAVLATGMYPEHSGILANTQYRPELSWLSAYGTENFDAIRRGDLLTDGHYLEAATIAETLQQAGFPTVVAGAKPVILFQDRAPKKLTAAQQESVTLFRGKTLPRSALQSLISIPEIGAFPKEASDADSTTEKIVQKIRSAKDTVLTWWNGNPKHPPLSRQVDRWTTRSTVYGLWKQGVPKFTVLWLSEPDASQHGYGVGSEAAKLGLEQCDQNLALVIQTLKDKDAFEKTDILVVSDHGFSTVDHGPELLKALKRANFVAGKQFDNPEPGDVMAVNLGGSTALYVFDHHEATVRKLVEFLQQSDFAGVIFTSVPAEGTFPLAQVHLAANRGAPDVLVSMRWSSDPNDWGAPGSDTAAEGKREHGTHASLSRFDLHNTLIAAGPDFKKGLVSDGPSGNVDIAPTVLAILGVSPLRPMDGRVLTEALTGSESPPPKPEHFTVEASRDLGVHFWHQSLKVSRVGSVDYLDEGNGQSQLK